jgi:hypothetical protein
VWSAAIVVGNEFTVRDVQHRPGYFPRFVHRMVIELGSFAPSVFLNVVKRDGWFGVHTEYLLPPVGLRPDLEHFPVCHS